MKLLRLALERMRLGRVAEEAVFEDAEVRYFFGGHFANKTSSYISRSFRYVSMFETMRGMSTKVGYTQETQSGRLVNNGIFSKSHSSSWMIS